MKNLQKSITLNCPICGNDHFEILDSQYGDFDNAPEEAKFRCSDCCNVYSKSEIIEYNQEKVQVAIDELSKDALSEIRKELRRALKK